MFSQRFIELTVPWEEVIPAAEFKQLKYSDLAAECRDRGLDRDHPSRRSWMQGLHGKVRNLASPSYWDKPEESHQGAGGGGREGNLLAVATEEGQELGSVPQ